MKNIYVIKIGGNVIDNDKELDTFLKQFTKIRGPKVLIHGGGKLASELSLKLGIQPQLVDGRRVTDSATLKIATMVYAGWINKSIVAKLNSNKVNAIGLSGADALLIPSKKRVKGKVDFGFVGDIIQEDINTKFLIELIEKRITPVIAPITCTKDGQLLNTNADNIASAVASTLSKAFKVNFVYCFEKDGVLNNSKVIKKLNERTFAELKMNEVIKDGMIPKLENAFSAFKQGSNVVIGSSSQLNKLISHGAGTTIIK